MSHCQWFGWVERASLSLQKVLCLLPLEPSTPRGGFLEEVRERLGRPRGGVW